MTEKRIVINVDYARKKLGSRAEKMSDEEVQATINLLRTLANRAIDTATKEKEQS